MVQSPTLASRVQDDAFHEIQLNGKQLVFLFMAATVVSVVIFLCGVLVGRGVRAAQDVQSASAASTAEPIADIAPGPPAVPQSMPGSGGTPSATPGDRDGEAPATVKTQVPTDELRPDPPVASRPPERKPEPPAATSAGAATPSIPPAQKPAPAAATPQAKPTPVQTQATNTTPAAPPAPPVEARAAASSNGWVVQLAALNDRGEAEEISRRLISKGYGAFVVTPSSGTPNVFRVRVGTFKTRGEAEVVGAKLKKEERFDPWITR